MNKTEAMDIYKALSQPPKNALRQITGGKLNGKTDINPQWRYKAMTEQFGMVGVGWKYDVKNLWTVPGAAGEILAFAQVAVFIKDGDQWSEPIVGIGGSKLVQLEKGTPVSNDEGYKMAVTDAFSTALKMLGVAADIYAGLWDGTKYKAESSSQAPAPADKKQQATAKAGQPKPEKKGGESTPEENARLNELCRATYANGQKVFTPQEIKQFLAYRAEKYTAQELIAFIENALRNRRADAPELAQFTEDIPWEEPAGSDQQEIAF